MLGILVAAGLQLGHIDLFVELSAWSAAGDARLSYTRMASRLNEF